MMNVVKRTPTFEDVIQAFIVAVLPGSVWVFRPEAFTDLSVVRQEVHHYSRRSRSQWPFRFLNDWSCGTKQTLAALGSPVQDVSSEVMWNAVECVLCRVGLSSWCDRFVQFVLSGRWWKNTPVHLWGCAPFCFCFKLCLVSYFGDFRRGALTLYLNLRILGVGQRFYRSLRFVLSWISAARLRRRLDFLLAYICVV